MKNSHIQPELVTIPKLEYEALVKAVRSLEQQMATQKEQLAAKDVLLKQYEESLKLAQLKLFGRSSEKFNKNVLPENQMSLSELGFVFNEVEATATDDQEDDINEYEELNYLRKKPTKKQLSKAENLEPFVTETIVYTLSGDDLACPVCDHEMADLKELDRYEVIWKPATVEVVKHKEHVYACPHCEKEDINTPFVSTQGFKPFLPKSSYSAETIAFIINQKYNLSLPLYRLEKDMADQTGLKFTRQTMSNLLLKTTDIYLEEIYQIMKNQLLISDHLQADETTLQVLHEKERPAEAQSWMWLYQTGRTQNPIVVYEYQETRAAKHPQEFLKTYKGYLQVDGYQSYEKLGDDVILVGCFAHARRHFADIKKFTKKADKNSVTEKALALIGELYQIEKKLKERYAIFDEAALLEIQKVRDEYSRPLIDDYFKLMANSYPNSTGKLRQAIGYSLNQKEKLVRYLEDPRLSIDNNASESNIRAFVLGRKNWLFSNTPNGARSSAIIYSLVITAKLNKLKLYDYLVYLFKNLQTLKEQENFNKDTIEPFLPWSDSIPDHLYSKVRR